VGKSAAQTGGAPRVFCKRFLTASRKAASVLPSATGTPRALTSGMVARRGRDRLIGRCVLVVLLGVALVEIDDETTGLSKGPVDPSDLGTRCAVMAGRDDRAYLHCAERAPRAPGVNAGRDESSPDRRRLHPSGSERGTRGHLRRDR
jgi:hypothetical protein